ncbi:sigma-70 family RNA polymerase sigma factor [Faecalibacterium prausnitzii]|nr:sigma-70 family RNA polymerase sigma factor [Faecalibacterium prausnitzii]
MKRSTKWPGSSLTERFSLENPSVGCCPAIFYSFRWPAPEKEQVLCLPSFRGCPRWRNIRSISKFSTFHVLSKIWRLHMGFNYGLEKKNFDRQWAIMRKQYEDAGMSIEVIQAMYEYDWSVFNAARSYQNHTQEIAAPSFEQGEEAYSPLMNKYKEAISITEHYRETKSRFTWIGEIEDERLLSALENLSDADLELITLYAYEEYDTVEISKVFGTTKQNISKKIRRITNFIKNFQIEVV